MPPDPAVWLPHFNRVKTPRLLSATPLMTHFSQSRPKLANEEIDFYYPLRSSLNYMKQNKTMGGKKRKKKKRKNPRAPELQQVPQWALCALVCAWCYGVCRPRARRETGRCSLKLRLYCLKMCRTESGFNCKDETRANHSEIAKLPSVIIVWKVNFLDTWKGTLIDAESKSSKFF